MNYLSPSEYETYGLEATTPAAWVTAASAVIDAHCRRATLAVAQYEERLRMPAGRNTVRLTYVPLVAVAPAATAIVSARGRYAMPRRGEWPFDDLSVDVALMFGLAGNVECDLDPAGDRRVCGQRGVDVAGECAGVVVQRSGCGLHGGAGDDSGYGEGGVRADRAECAGDAGTECAGRERWTGCGWNISPTRWWMRRCARCWRRTWRRKVG